MGDYENILYETDDDRIATITLNRPDQMNAISPDLERELHEALDEAAADDAVRTIILTGHRPRLLRRLRPGPRPRASRRRGAPRSSSGCPRT